MTNILTPAQTSGPLFGFSLLDKPLSASASPGSEEAINIEGQILDGQNKPLVMEALVEFWSDGQACRSRTDRTGIYQVTMRKPARANTLGEGAAAPALNVLVFARGLSKHVLTRLYFPDEAEANQADPILGQVDSARRKTLIAKPGKNANSFTFDIHLQGEDETVFFSVE
jgi:protocatechuate 3,4-dioxygenase alpha subunit